MNQTQRLPLDWTYNDGGRAAAGYRGYTNDCVVRAIAIAAAIPYSEVYDALYDRQRAWADSSRSRHAKATRGTSRTSPRTGVFKEVYEPYLLDVLDFTWTPLMAIGTGCTVHLAKGEFPPGPPRDSYCIARLSRHVAAVIDGVVHDTSDPTRNGDRCVYGYWELT